MSVYKQFSAQDVIITPFYANKGFYFTGGEIVSSNVGIDILTGVNTPNSTPFIPSEATTGLTAAQYQRGVYGVAKNLYYTNYISSSIPTQSYFTGSNITSRYENYLQSNLPPQRYFPTESNSEITVISIPTALLGENIVPTTFKLVYSSTTLIDDGEGNLMTGSNYVGNVFYAHGTAIITSGSLKTLGSTINNNTANLSNLSLYFSSSITIYESQYRISIKDSEYNYTFNPSVLSGSSVSGALQDFVTGSDFAPYVTTVGLYNDNKELLAVTKLAFPLKMPSVTDLNIIVNFDM